jgi:Tfp pilus assembly pilus retraction ATPase PilT
MNTIATSRIDIDSILSALQDPNISDIHLTSSGRSSYRLNGDIIQDERIPLLDNETMENILKQLFQNNIQSLDKFICDKESDFSYE